MNILKFYFPHVKMHFFFLLPIKLKPAKRGRLTSIILTLMMHFPQCCHHWACNLPVGTSDTLKLFQSGAQEAKYHQNKSATRCGVKSAFETVS